MRARELLTHLRQRGVAFEADGDRLSVDAPPGVIDGRLRELLVE
ncbi:MAG: hypothetical protein H0V83_11255, partial [Rubrobacter sp.]|nr:hypothetical protein [Rubrobacter sp.]